MAVLAIGAVVLLGYWWYLSGLEEDCRRQCLAAGKGYQYTEGTTSGRRFRAGICSCMER